MNNTINDIEKLIENNKRIRLSDIPQEQIEKGKEYISKADLSQIVFNGKAIPFADIDNPIELVQYLTSKSKINDLSEKYVSHYTNFDTA